MTQWDELINSHKYSAYDFSSILLNAQGDELINSLKYLAYNFLSILLNDIMGWSKQLNEIVSLRFLIVIN